MFCLKLWYLFWLNFLFNSFLIIGEHQDFNFNFKKSDKREESPTKFSICVRITKNLEENGQAGFIVPSKLLKRVYGDLRKTFEERKTKFVSDLKETLLFEKTTEELNKKLRNSENEIESSLNEIRSRLQQSLDDPTLFEKLVKEQGSYFRKDLACYLIHERLFDYLNILAGMSYRLYAYPGKPNFYTPFLVFEHHEHDAHLGLRLMKNTIQKCPGQRTNISTFSFFECMNDCLKKDARKSIYMFKITDDERVYLNETQRNYGREWRCFNDCRKSVCFIEEFIGVNSLSGIERTVIALESYRDSRFEFWIKFVSLLCLFTNTSIYYLLTESSKTPVRLLCSFFKNKKLAVLVRNNHWLLFALCFISTASISSNILRSYLNCLNDPVKSEVAYFSFLPETFSLVICVPIQLNLTRKKQLTLRKDEKLLEKYSFAEIEEATNDDLEMVLKRAYLKKIKELPVDLKRSEKVYFKNNHFVALNRVALSRCFRMEFPRTVSDSIEKYRDQLVTTNLILELDAACFYRLSSGLDGYEQVEHLCQVYLLDKFRPFSSNAFQHENAFQINRRSIKKSRSFLQKNCTDYDEPRACPHCTRQSSIERCINREFLRKFRNLSIESNTVIDREEFNQSSLTKIYFKQTMDRNITEECERKSSLEDCSSSYFEKSYRRLNQYDRPVIEINLDFENIEEKDLESSSSKLLTDLLSTVILFFGTNINLLIVYIASMVNRFAKIREKLMRFLVLLCCTTGFSLHALWIYSSILHAPLVASAYYSKPYPFFYPNLTFCFEYKRSKIDPNFKFTISTLDEQTSHLTFDKVFEGVYFINKSDKLIELKFDSLPNASSRPSANSGTSGKNFPGLYRSDPHDRKLEVMTYYLFDKKCFLLKLNEGNQPVHELRHEKHEFYHRDDAYPLKMFFDKQTMRSVDKIVLSSMQGNVHKNFEFEISTNQTFFGKKRKRYRVASENLRIVKVDEFRLISEALRGQERDGKGCLNRAVDYYKSKYKLATLNLIEETGKRSPEYEINDEMFLQFLEQRADLFDDRFSGEMTREIFSNFVNVVETNRTDKADLEFSPVAYIKTARLEREQGAFKFFIASLNTLSFWLSLCILDLHPLLSAPFHLFTLLLRWPYRKLSTLKLFLWNNVQRFANERVVPPNFLNDFLVLICHRCMAGDQN